MRIHSPFLRVVRVGELEVRAERSGNLCMPREPPAGVGLDRWSGSATGRRQSIIPVPTNAAAFLPPNWETRFGRPIRERDDRFPLVGADGRVRFPIPDMNLPLHDGGLPGDVHLAGDHAIADIVAAPVVAPLSPAPQVPEQALAHRPVDSHVPVNPCGTHTRPPLTGQPEQGLCRTPLQAEMPPASAPATSAGGINDVSRRRVTVRSLR